jgi:Tol biopolymer transport system component
MNAFDRFDPFERRIAEAIDEIATARLPDYLDDVFQVTVRSSQRPRWTFLERWLPMDTTLARGPVGRLPIRSLALLLLLLAIVGGAIAAYVGSQRPVLAPFGPAGNGQLVFGLDGDLYAAETLTSQPQLLVGGPGEQAGAVLSPDGLLVAYDSSINGRDYVWVADADGSNARLAFRDPFLGHSFAWAPDSRRMAIVTDIGGELTLWIAKADGSAALRLDLEGLRPWEAAWDPQQEDVLLVRAEDRATGKVDLYYVDIDGAAILSKLGLSGELLTGPDYEFSGMAFSPDGSTIAYNVVGAVEPPFNRFRVHAMNRDGTNDRELPAPLDTRYSQAWPVFSPDGATIIMESWETGADGTSETRISRLAMAPADASAVARSLGPSKVGQTLVKTWSPDGSYILIGFELNEVYAVDPESGEADKLPWLSDLPGWQRTLR